MTLCDSMIQNYFEAIKKVKFEIMKLSLFNLITFIEMHFELSLQEN